MRKLQYKGVQGLTSDPCAVMPLCPAWWLQSDLSALGDAIQCIDHINLMVQMVAMLLLCICVYCYPSLLRANKQKSKNLGEPQELSFSHSALPYFASNK